MQKQQQTLLEIKEASNINQSHVNRCLLSDTSFYSRIIRVLSVRIIRSFMQILCCFVGLNYSLYSLIYEFYTLHVYSLIYTL